MMETQQPERHIGRKIWYGAAITLSVLVLLVSTAGVIGTWVVEQSLADLSVKLFITVEDTAGGIRQFAGRIDQGAGEVREISSEVSTVSSQISQNVEDQGLLRLLLPEEKEQKLISTIQSIRDTLNSIAEVVRTGLDLYNSLDRLPFVSLPRPTEERIEEIQQSVADTEADIEALRQGVRDIRSGAAEQITRITEIADRVTGTMDSLSGRLSALDTDLAAVQDFAVRMQSTIPTLFAVLAVVATLLMVYVSYTQVEVIRLFVARWRMLGGTTESAAVEAEREEEPQEVESTPGKEPDTETHPDKPETEEGLGNESSGD